MSKSEMLDTGRAPPPSQQGAECSNSERFLRTYCVICVCPVPPCGSRIGVCPRDAQHRDHHQSSAQLRRRRVRGVLKGERDDKSEGLLLLCQHHAGLRGWLIKQHQLHAASTTSMSRKAGDGRVLDLVREAAAYPMDMQFDNSVFPGKPHPPSKPFNLPPPGHLLPSPLRATLPPLPPPGHPLTSSPSRTPSHLPRSSEGEPLLSLSCKNLVSAGRQGVSARPEDMQSDSMGGTVLLLVASERQKRGRAAGGALRSASHKVTLCHGPHTTVLH